MSSFFFFFFLKFLPRYWTVNYTFWSSIGQFLLWNSLPSEWWRDCIILRDMSARVWSSLLLTAGLLSFCSAFLVRRLECLYVSMIGRNFWVSTTSTRDQCLLSINVLSFVEISFCCHILRGGSPSLIIVIGRCKRSFYFSLMSRGVPAYLRWLDGKCFFQPKWCVPCCDCEILLVLFLVGREFVWYWLCRAEDQHRNLTKLALFELMFSFVLFVISALGLSVLLHCL